jgi:hypothetical protein
MMGVTSSHHAPQTGLGASSSTSAFDAADNTTTRASAELKRMWQSALRTCKAADSDKSGFVSRAVFIDSLEKHLGKEMNPSGFNSLADSYAIGDDVDYHTCFRACLNNVMNGSTSNEKSKFTMAPLSQARAARESHPWQFQYITNGPEAIQANAEIPYWKRACMKPRTRPSTTQHAMSLDSSSYGFTKTTPASLDVKEYEPKVISTANKVANHPVPDTANSGTS